MKKLNRKNLDNSNSKLKNKIDELPLVSIIMPIHNHNQITVDCLDSVMKIDYPNSKIEIIISDGATNDGTLDLVKDKLENMKTHGYCRVKLLENKIDPGPVVCVNQCFNQTNKNSKYILKLDNDVIMAPDSLIKGIEKMEKDKIIGVVGGKVFCNDNPTVPAISHCACFFNFFIGRAKCYANNEITFCDYISGCYSLIRKEIVDQPFLDEKFFVYHDDVDFCIRIKNKGYSIMYSPDIKIWHRGSVTTGAKDWSKSSIYYNMRNRLLLEKLHAKYYHKLFFYPFFIFISVPQFLMKIVFKKRIKEIPIRMKAVKDFLSNRQGKQKI